MISDVELGEIEDRAASTTGVRWGPGRAPDGSHVITVELDDGSAQQISMTREREPASAYDVEFVAHGRNDAEGLIAFLRGTAPLSTEQLEEVARRCDRASPAPWKLFLESDGGVGGGSVIWVSDQDDESDLYLWAGSKPAAEVDFEFVAAIRQDLPRLIAEARGRLAS